MYSDKKRITIAIDGFSSCGKSTLAKALANELNYVFIDSGAMYRGVCWYALKNGLIINNVIDDVTLIEELPFIDLSFGVKDKHKNRPLLVNSHDVSAEIRSLEISQYVSPVSAIKEVRQKLVQQQQLLGQSGGVVMDGRDIGTVVFPEAELKLFMTASIDIRTQRRYDEMLAKGQPTTLDLVRQNLQDRDLMDSTRDESPLRQSADAIVIDNSHMDEREQLDLALSLVKEAVSQQVIS